MDIENTETLGLGQMVERVSALALRGTADVLAIELPSGALPPGALVEKPTVLVLKKGDGALEVMPIAPLLKDLLGKPARRKGVATTTTLESFCDLVKRNGDSDTVIFVDANWRSPKLCAVLNYNQEVPLREDSQRTTVMAGDDPLARFGDHRVAYAFPLSESWKVWVENNGKEKAMKQDAFAAFLEDHVHEIGMPDTDPDGGDAQWVKKFRTSIATPNELIDLARGLEVTVGAKIKTKARLQSGEMSLVFDVEHRSANGEALTVPGLFWLNIPVFYRGASQRILVRLRYRPAGENGVVWYYDIFRPDEAVDERVRADVERVQFETNYTVIDGAPEV